MAILQVSGCEPTSQNHQPKYCLNQLLYCAAEDFPEVYFQLESAIRIERPIAFTIHLPKAWQIEQVAARLVGLNMQMGQIPIKLNPNTEGHNQYSGTLFIVACTRPDMEWQIELEVQLKHSSLSQFIHWPLSTFVME